MKRECNVVWNLQQESAAFLNSSEIVDLPGRNFEENLESIRASESFGAV